MAKELGSAIRSLRRAPAFTGLVVLTLALGIGATTAVFSVVDAVLINPLPFLHADRLSEIWLLYSRDGSRDLPLPGVVVRAARDEQDVFASVEAYAFGRAILTGHGEPDDIMFAGITPGLPALLGVAPSRGRLFTQDDVASRERVVLISERLWASRFGRDPSILSRPLTLDDQSYAIVGVLPRKFRFPDLSADVWHPLDVSDRAKPARVQLLVSRRPGVSLSQANERLAAVSAGLRDQGTLGKGQNLGADILFQMRSGRRGVNSLYLLLGAVSLVLLVACVNVTNLLLVRASARHGELALMNALGAGRAVLVRSAVVESLLLAATGGLFGVLVANGLLRVILGLAPADFTFLARASPELDPRAVAFAIGITVLTCVVSGGLPAWRTSGIDAVDALKQRSNAMIGARDDWWQSALVAGQLALVIVLLTGAGLLLRSFNRLTNVDLGFDPRRLAMVYVDLSSRYAAPDAALSFMRQVESRVESSLGVRVAITSSYPVRPGGYDADAQPEAEGQASPSAVLALPMSRVSPDYFQTLGIPIVEGRTFIPEDDAEAIIVNDVIARRYWGAASPVGRRFRLDPKQPWQTVVGVARDIKTMGPSDAVGEGTEVYLPFVRGRQAPFLSLLIATTGNQEAELQQVKRMIWDLDGRVPILAATTMVEHVSESVARPRFLLTLTGAFAIAAVLLSAIGVYGVCAYWVSRRRRELAIRMALGATPARLRGMVIGRGLRLAAAGAVVGLAAALAGARVLESLLFDTSARDPLTLAGVAAALAAIAVLACSVPAMKAGRADPMSDLRAE